MTVEELIRRLSAFDGSMPIILQKDAEGNGFSPLAGADGENLGYEAESDWSGWVKYLKLTPELAKLGYTEDDTGNGVPCVVLYPVN